MRALGLLLVVVMAAEGAVRAQEGASPPVTMEAITAVIGSDDDARAVFQTVLAHMFRPKTKAFLLWSQIRPEWLPRSLERMNSEYLSQVY